MNQSFSLSSGSLHQEANHCGRWPRNTRTVLPGNGKLHSNKLDRVASLHIPTCFTLGASASASLVYLVSTMLYPTEAGASTSRTGFKYYTQRSHTRQQSKQILTGLQAALHFLWTMDSFVFKELYIVPSSCARALSGYDAAQSLVCKDVKRDQIFSFAFVHSSSAQVR